MNYCSLSKRIIYEDYVYYNLLELCETDIKFINIIKSSYLTLMKELTETSDISDELFISNLRKINEYGIIYVCVKGDYSDFEIIGSGTLIVEPKIIRGGKPVGHIEDIVVKKKYRGNKISFFILDLLKKTASDIGCYKVILDCTENLCHVYELNNFQKKGVQMAIYF